MPSRTRLAAAGVIAVAIAISATACGSGGSTASTGSSGSSGSGTTASSALARMSADQIVQKSVADLKAASSVRITGNLVDDGQSIVLNLTDVAAQGCQGTIGLAASGSATVSAAMSGKADIIVADSIVYMKLDQAFFTNAGLPASVYTAVAGKYIKVTATSELASFAQLCNASNLSSAFAKEDTGFVKAGSATINGQTVLAFKQPKNAANGAVYVSDSATPEIVRIAGSGSQGAINFTDYNAPATVTAPPSAQVIDGSKFGL